MRQASQLSRLIRLEDGAKGEDDTVVSSAAGRLMLSALRGHSPDDSSTHSLNDYSLHPSSPNSLSPAQLCSCSELWHREKAHTLGLCLHLPSKMFFIFPPPHFPTTICVYTA